jgi:Tol biopolymer transport system component
MPLSGGLYYWTTAGANDTSFNTAVARYDFSGDSSAPQLWLSSAQAPAVPAGQAQCIGCHALSPDGHKLAFSLGGSLPGFFALYDVATRKVTLQNMNQKYVNMTTFSRDGSEMVNMAYGVLTLRTADAAATVLSDNLFATTVKEQMSHPFWSPDGTSMAFVSWVPGMFGAVGPPMDTQHVTGDMVQGAQIWIVGSDGKTFTGTPKVLVPRSPLDATGNATYSSYYPSISDDGTWVVFDRSQCNGPANAIASDWGAGACDGYNDYSAQLMLVGTGGGTPLALANANGTKTWTNSWPRWSPEHGQFRGNKLYWIAFSSRRDFGLSLQGSTDGSTKPQMWFTAVVVDPANPMKDPSFAPVWLPGQDPDLTGPRGNHTPAWTSVALPIP